MDPIDLLAKEDLGGLVFFCLFAAFVVASILIKAVKSVSPEAMARKIRELQGQREGVRTVPARYEEPVYAELVSPDASAEPKKKRKKKRLEPDLEEVTNRLVEDVQPAKKASAATGATTASTAAMPLEGAPSLRQAVIYAELLAPPLSLRRGPGRGLLRSAPWIR